MIDIRAYTDFNQKKLCIHEMVENTNKVNNPAILFKTVPKSSGKVTLDQFDNSLYRLPCLKI